MKVSGLTIESLYQEKIVLYQNLLDVLEMERENIIDMDLDALWKVSDKKSGIARKIENKQKQIFAQLMDLPLREGMDMSAMDAQTIIDLLPAEIRERLGKLRVTLRVLKEEMQTRLKQNRGYVGEYLTVLDEIICLIAGTGKGNPVYDRDRRAGSSSTHLFLHREV